MSSPLDGRIRTLARQEIASALGDTSGDGSSEADQVAALDLKVTELTNLVKRLDARLDAVEKQAGQTDQEAQPAARRTRKASE
jgi:hypothetical protein